MMKKMMTVLFVLGFVFSMVLFTSSCAKKQIAGEEEVTMVPEPVEEPAVEEPKPPVEDDLSIEKQAFESENIYFDFDKSELKPGARAILTKKAAWLREHPQFDVLIEGHCDERGTNEYNLALGERRANAAWKFLNALGVSGDRMTTVSYGEERPAYLGHNEAAWSKNRRDEFKLR